MALAEDDFASLVVDTVLGGAAGGATKTPETGLARKFAGDMSPAEASARVESVLNAHLASVLAHGATYGTFARRRARRRGNGCLWIEYSSAERACTAEECAVTWLPVAAAATVAPGVGRLLSDLIGAAREDEFACVIAVTVDEANRGWYAPAIVRYGAEPGIFKCPPRTDVLDYDPCLAADSSNDAEARYLAWLESVRVPPGATSSWPFASLEQFKAECVSFSTDAAQRVRGAYGMPLYTDDYDALCARVAAQDLLLPCMACNKHETHGYEFDVTCARCRSVAYCSQECRVADAKVHGGGATSETPSECAAHSAPLGDSGGEVEY